MEKINYSGEMMVLTIITIDLINYLYHVISYLTSYANVSPKKIEHLNVQCRIIKFTEKI